MSYRSTRASTDSRLDACETGVLPRMRGVSERCAESIYGPGATPDANRGGKPRMNCLGGARRASLVGLIEGRKGVAMVRIPLTLDAG